MFAAVPSVKVVVLDVASLITTEVGLKPAVAPVGKFEPLKFTVPVKPASGVTVTEYWAEPPGTTVREEGFTDTTKSGVADAGAEATKVL